MPALTKSFYTLTVLFSFLYTATAWSDQTLTCARVTVAPTIDGQGDDDAWLNGQEVSLKDAVVDTTHSLRCLYDDDRIYLKARYTDGTENRTHKTSVWSQESSDYSKNKDREDTLVIKWNMHDNTGDISINSDTPYKADVWYWKAFRTDPLGYADDKYHVYSKNNSKKAKKRFSKTGNQFFLERRGDEGVSTYKSIVYTKKGAQLLPSYSHRQPSASRADIKAKGEWKNGQWTVEFSRLLDTGHTDDVRFNTNRRYQFGVSKHEIAGAKPLTGSNNPMHGNGEIYQTVTLVFKDKIAAK